MAEDTHISDDNIERLLLGMIKDEAERERIEEHLLACEKCVRRAEETREYIRTIRAALARTEASTETQPSQKPPSSVKRKPRRRPEK